MARTTSILVQGVLRADYVQRAKDDLTPDIAAASIIVDDMVLCAATKGITYDSTRLELIERLIAAWHYKGCHDQQLSSKSTGGASGSFTGQTAFMLTSNHYGQRAMALDRSGCLAAALGAVERKKARAAWLGKRPSEQTAYRDRD